MKDKLRWRADLAIFGNTVVGSISEGANGLWYAYGCMDDWEDTPLGNFDYDSQAKQAVEQWVKDHE